MGARAGLLLLSLAVLSGWVTDPSRSRSRAPLVAPAEAPRLAAEIFPLALRYKQQILEKIEAPWLTRTDCKVPYVGPSAVTLGPSPPTETVFVVSGADLHYLFMSLQQ